MQNPGKHFYLLLFRKTSLINVQVSCLPWPNFAISIFQCHNYNVLQCYHLVTYVPFSLSLPYVDEKGTVCIKPSVSWEDVVEIDAGQLSSIFILSIGMKHPRMAWKVGSTFYMTLVGGEELRENYRFLSVFLKLLCY